MIWGSNSTIFVSSHAKSNWENMYLIVKRLCLGTGVRRNIYISINISISEF